MIDAATPYSITGPAMVKIFAPTPSTKPSVLHSRAGETTEFQSPL